MKRLSLFKKSLLLYTIILLTLATFFLLFVYGNLKKYEKNLLEPLLLNAIQDLTKKELQNYLEEAGQDKNLLATFEQMVKREDYKFVNTKEHSYDAYLDDRVLFSIQLKALGEKNCLGLLKYEKYEIEKITPHLEKGLIYYKIVIPSNYKLFLDDKIYVEKEKEEKYSELSFMYSNSAMPKLVTYEIQNLDHLAKIEVEDFIGKKVTLKQDDFYYEMDEPIRVENQEEAEKYIGKIDILTMAKNWSLFLTKDLKGANYGFENFKKYLIEGTEMWQKAYNWAHSIDITFTSQHTLKTPPFTGVKIDNFTIYGTEAFSCNVYLEKHMVVKGKEQIDIMQDTMYFIKDKGEWKLMNIKGITKQ